MEGEGRQRTDLRTGLGSVCICWLQDACACTRMFDAMEGSQNPLGYADRQGRASLTQHLHKALRAQVEAGKVSIFELFLTSGACSLALNICVSVCPYFCGVPRVRPSSGSRTEATFQSEYSSQIHMLGAGHMPFLN